jgi:hypothetical protein
MIAKFEITLEFDPAKKSRLIEAAQQLFRERCTDEEGNEIPAEDDDPTISNALMELIHCAIEDDKRCRELGVTLDGMRGDEILKEEQVQ